MTSGKILATVVGVAAAAILITQLASAKSEEEPQIVENWLNVALGPVKNTTYTCAKTGKNMAARDLTSHLPQSVFFGNSFITIHALHSRRASRSHQAYSYLCTNFATSHLHISPPFRGTESFILHLPREGAGRKKTSVVRRLRLIEVIHYQVNPAVC